MEIFDKKVAVSFGVVCENVVSYERFQVIFIVPLRSAAYLLQIFPQLNTHIIKLHYIHSFIKHSLTFQDTMFWYVLFK